MPVLGLFVNHLPLLIPEPDMPPQEVQSIIDAELAGGEATGESIYQALQEAGFDYVKAEGEEGMEEEEPLMEEEGMEEEGMMGEGEEAGEEGTEIGKETPMPTARLFAAKFALGKKPKKGEEEEAA